ncbi:MULTISPECIES: hybrid sensor histidine kinase/response regulator [unclassified Rhizobium]|uniref:hybrid sensor histidine kinase/response regulator n=1 Tax=unclassified Rhizobium TaxID=2613769 RepID=UPI0025DDC835|nr:ATP-binding protein [Rhizobium sp. UBA1881]
MLGRTTTIHNTNAAGLIYAPLGRDAQIAAGLLAEAGIRAEIVPDLVDFVAKLGEDIAFVVITEETLRSADLRPISEWVERQPSWSDLPFVVLTARGAGPERNPQAARLSEILGNVSFVERPFHATTFVSVVRSALRGRRRQYEARQRIIELDEGERRLQTALEAGRLGAWELDLDTDILTTSAACRAIFGRGNADILLFDEMVGAVHPEDLTRLTLALNETRETGADLAIDYRVIWSDRTVHWIEMRAQRYRDKAGRATKIVGVSADITARLEAEQQQRQLNELLEQRVEERTRALEQAHAIVLDEVSQRERAEEQLRQSQKMEAIGQLTGGVAHDFNNLLMAVLGNLELLRKRFADDEKATRLVDGAMQGAKRGASLTQRLLAFSRRQDLKVGAVDLGQLVAGIEDMLKRSVGSTVTVITSVPEHLPPVWADANQVELALLNLAVNARDAMSEGGTIRVELKTAEVASSANGLSPGSYVVLSVADNGSGMDKATLEKATEPFFSTKELGKGTGLGLSMIHGLALQLKGRLKLDSVVGIGTTAELWIPVSDVLPTAAATEDLVPTSRADLKKPIRILFVDDDALIAMSSTDMLLDLGHDVVEVHSGEEALQQLQDDATFDLLITDYSMPGMNGGELATAARQTISNLPILIASGYADLPPGVSLDVARLGKPYSQDQLASAIGKVMANIR